MSNVQNNGKLSATSIIKEANNDAESLTQAADWPSFPTTGMLRVRPAQEVIRQSANQPDPVLLFPPLIVEGELTILFADTGIGKTVYAVQAGIEIAKVKPVLYVDLELSDKQFEKRYRDAYGAHYTFPANFYRADFVPRFQAPNGISYEQYFIQSLEESIDVVNAEVIVIDNMTKLAAGDTDSAKTAIPILNELSRLKFDRGLTIIVLEHNKKVDPFRPISLNDLQGSKMKSNFADAVFSIGRSQTDKYLRYVKQLKVRSAELVYDTENVAVYEITTEGGYLHFKPTGYGSEFEHLKQAMDDQRIDAGKEKYDQIQQARQAGFKGDALAKHLGWTKGYISQIERKYGGKAESDQEFSESLAD